MEGKRLIFLSNDDGYDRAGFRTLIEFACRYGYVFAVAPATHQSGKSASITIDTPLRPVVVEQNERFTLINVNGTPVDCAKLAFNKLLPRVPDLTLSGINYGYNASVSDIYSGTMGVVYESSLYGVPSIGFSYSEYAADTDFSPCLGVMQQVVDYVLAKGLPAGVVLNVNIPKTDGEVNGIKITKGAAGKWVEEYDEHIDEKGEKYYTIAGCLKEDDENNTDSDTYWLKRGYATITPCRASRNAEDVMLQMRGAFADEAE